jgi:hypothetical protein
LEVVVGFPGSYRDYRAHPSQAGNDLIVGLLVEVDISDIAG